MSGVDLGYQVFIPPRLAAPRFLVTVHGRKSSPAELIDAFSGLAGRRGIALLAPDFTTMEQVGYQWLAAAGTPLAAARGLEQVLARAARRFDMVEHSHDFVGFSGGAQFVHRFAMMHPALVNSVVAASAGWYSECDAERLFPEGMMGASDRVNLDRFLELPIRVAVGERDTMRSRNFRTSPKLDAAQGSNRLERARFWVDHLHAAAARRGIASRATLTIMPGCGHNLAQAIGMGGLEALVEQAIDSVSTVRAAAIETAQG